MSLYNPNTNIEVFDFSEALKRIKKGRKYRLYYYSMDKVSQIAIESTVKIN